ncbi:MAG: DUF3667 domain-containing protein [Luteimonas sp.]
MSEATAAAQAAPAQCENCGEPLRGEYCYACGQSVHSPLRHATHALEEVFESFWHLDGRIFRTLRDLMVPGRAANEYIAGHRARYVAPLRLFVILSVLTFFVAQFSIQLDNDTVINLDSDSEINLSKGADTGLATGADAHMAVQKAKTVAEVERIRDSELANIARARASISKNIPAGTVTLDFAANSLRAQAKRRITELERAAKTQPIGPTKPAATTPSPSSAPSATTNAPAPAAKPVFTMTTSPPESKSDPGVAMTSSFARSKSDPNMAWDAKANPIAISWLPPFANRSLNAQSERASRNVMLIRKDPQRYFHAVIAAVPSTLFVLVPVFALLLKIFYLFKRRLYMEHLVVALYSHAFLLLALLLVFISMALRHSYGTQLPALDTTLSWIEGLILWLGMPLYLLLTQKSVYRQGWPMTLLKYCMLGTIYSCLLAFCIGATFVLSLMRM